MPWSNDERGGLHGPTVWRALIVGLAVVLAGVVIGIVVLFKANRSRIEDTQQAIHQTHQALHKTHQALAAVRGLACRTGSFLTGQPITQQPGQTQADFEETVRKVESFLHGLRSQDCTQVKGALISAQQITHQLHQLHEVVPKGGGVGNGGGSPPGQPGPPSGGPPPTPKPHCTVEVNALGQHVCVEAP